MNNLQNLQKFVKRSALKTFNFNYNKFINKKPIIFVLICINCFIFFILETFVISVVNT